MEVLFLLRMLHEYKIVARNMVNIYQLIVTIQL